MPVVDVPDLAIADDPTPARPLRKNAAMAASLHIGAKRASVAQERQRAREVVANAKTRLAESFSEIRFGKRLNADQLWPMVSGIAASIKRHPAALVSVTRLKDRHEYTYLHSIAVCGLMIGLARWMGLAPALHREIGMAGLLHDIGKARVPTMLLDKPGPLTLAEKDIVRSHSLWGYETMTRGAVGLEGASPLSDLVLDVCLHHHERIDGSGYPDRQRGGELSIYSRMAAICDTYDAATTARVYKPAMSPAEVLEWMAGRSGEYDSNILGQFMSMIGIFPVGSLVRLQSSRLAVVLDDPDNETGPPPVCPFYCIETRQALPWRRSAPGLDPILGIELPTRWPMLQWAHTRSAILAEFDAAPLA